MLGISNVRGIYDVWEIYNVTGICNVTGIYDIIEIFYVVHSSNIPLTYVS